MAYIPMFVSDNGVIYNLAGTAVGSTLPLTSIADYLGSIDVGLKTGTYIRFSEAFGYSYNCYRFISGVMYAADAGNPLCGGNCTNC
jgi:hypothetical protein